MLYAQKFVIPNHRLNCLRVLRTTRKRSTSFDRNTFLFEHVGSITFPIYVQSNTELLCTILILYFLFELKLRVIELCTCLSVSRYLEAVMAAVFVINLRSMA